MSGVYLFIIFSHYLFIIINFHSMFGGVTRKEDRKKVICSFSYCSNNEINYAAVSGMAGGPADLYN